MTSVQRSRPVRAYLVGRNDGAAAHAVAAAARAGNGRPVRSRCGALVDAAADSEFYLVRALDGRVRAEARMGGDSAPPCAGCVTLLKRDGAPVRDVVD